MFRCAKTDSIVLQTDPNRFKNLSHRKTIGSCYTGPTISCFIRKDCKISIFFYRNKAPSRDRDCLCVLTLTVTRCSDSLERGNDVYLFVCVTLNTLYRNKQVLWDDPVLVLVHICLH